MGDMDSSPELSKAPKVLQDELLFPYLAGITFTQHLLKAGNGWPDFYKVFEKPPVSTQQIMHPDLYLQGVVPAKIDLPATKGVVSAEWKKLDENDMGEFGVQEILKQFLPKDRSTTLAAAWAGDRYAIFENQKNKRTLLEFRVRLASDADAARFFGAYSEILEMKYDQRTNLMRRPNFFSFDTPEDGVFLRCMDSDCFVLEGGNRAMFDRLTMEMGWPAGPVVPVNPSDPHVHETAFPVYPSLFADAGRLCGPRHCELSGAGFSLWILVLGLAWPKPHRLKPALLKGTPAQRRCKRVRRRVRRASILPARSLAIFPSRWAAACNSAIAARTQIECALRLFRAVFVINRELLGGLDGGFERSLRVFREQGRFSCGWPGRAPARSASQSEMARV